MFVKEFYKYEKQWYFFIRCCDYFVFQIFIFSWGSVRFKVIFFWFLQIRCMLVIEKLVYFCVFLKVNVMGKNEIFKFQKLNVQNILVFVGLQFIFESFCYF